MIKQVVREPPKKPGSLLFWNGPFTQSTSWQRDRRSCIIIVWLCWWIIYLSSGLKNNRSKYFCGHVEHRCKLVQIAEVIIWGKTFHRDELVIVPVWRKYLGVPAESRAPLYQGQDVGGAGDLAFPCPNRAGGTHFTDGKRIFWEVPAVGIALLDLKTGIL